MTASLTATAPGGTRLSTWQVLVAHDLKNALGTLEAQLERLTAEPDPALAREAHRRCRDLRRRLVMLLTVQRGEADGALPCWPTDEDPLDLLRAAARDAAESAAATGPGPAPRIDVDPAGAPPFWTLDPRLVRLALDAALDNARRFARARIVLQAAVDDGRLVLAVLDDGPGPAATGAAGDAPHGTGLGTALCRAVAQAHVAGDRTGDVGLDDHGLPGPDGRPGGRFRLRLP